MLRAGNSFPALLLLFLIFLYPCTAAGQDNDFAADDEFTGDDYFFEDPAGITIVGTPQTSQQMAVIDKADIEKRGASDLANLLQETLDLNITRYGAYGNQTGVSLRGFDSKRVAFLIDGVPVNSAMDGKFDINQIDLRSVERIEVIYGGSDSKYNVSGALGGVINIITVKKQQPGWRFGGTVSNTSALPREYRDRSDKKQSPRWEDLLDAQNYAVSAVYGSESFSFSSNAFANRAANHFVFMDSYKDYRRKDNNEVWDTGLAMSMVWGFSSLAKLISSTKLYYGDKNVPTTGFSRDFGRQNDFSSRQSFMLDVPRAGHDDLAAEFSLTWNFGRMDYEPPSGAASRHDQQDLNAVNRWSWYPGEKLTLRSGVDYRFNFLDSLNMGNHSRHDGGVYLAAEYKPVRQFLVIPSVKAVFTSSNAIEAVPKLGFLWNITDALALRNNYFRSFKFPDFEELYWAQAGYFGNPDLNKEDGWGGDIGTEWNFRELLKLENTFFAQWLKDSIHWYSGGGGIWRPENVGEAVFFGLDNKLGFEIPVSFGPVKKISPSFSYKYLRSYLLSFGYSFASDKRIPYNPEHTVGFSLDISWGGGSLLISGYYESLRYVDRPNFNELMPYFLLNATLNQEISNYLSVFGSLRNILNTSYETYMDYPMPGISLTLGVKVQF
ncbi:MAG: TonB-dependent receptor [Treponema sp.]|nr:TonB-dependent receptor [Treponema sp.]